MGQFKPMVKMETTEPTVELKLKKGGHVNMKKGGMAEGGHKKMAMGGGAMDMMMGTPALVGRPAVNAPVRAPGKPSMASRRKSMMAKKPAAMAMPPMKKGGNAETSKMKGLEKELKSHESKPASKGHKGLKTGGVAMGNAGGFKTGGVALGNAGGFKKGGMMGGGETKKTPEKKGFFDSAKDTIKEGAMQVADDIHYMTGTERGKNIEKSLDEKYPYRKKGMKTGGVALGNAGGFKHGGKSSKKAYATGGTVDSGKPVAMPQGDKKPSQPVSTNRQAGTFKKGGKVTPAEGNLMKAFGKENAPAMKSAKAQSNDVYSKYQKMQKGGSPTPDESFFDKNKVDPKSASDKANRELEEAMNPLSMVKELAGKAKNYFMPKADSVTKTKESVTVTPANKKRGGRAC